MPGLLKTQVVNGSGEALANIVVELSANSVDDRVFAVTGKQGTAVFSNVPQGALRITAHADGYISSTATVPRDSRKDVVVTLSTAPSRPGR